MRNIYAKNFFNRVLSNSVSNNWDRAVLEWEITGSKEDDLCETSCICGKENIRYIFEITNKKNKQKLYPVGSSCIKKFKRNDLNEETSIYKKLYILENAVHENSFITLSSDYFSRKLLKFFYDNSAFNDGKYDAKTNYDFILDMFNKRDKSSITLKQKKKITAIILSDIIPFVKKKLNKARSDEL
ncbi:transcriptional regulator [Liquorilactobacillus satsumensis]|uniref:transcriptional regulator n=1 Tax=Liquorilactobacillus satsumensis TaxID=259059 RepID=UPI0021C41E16|nr:transcriptional regulator [Liquorilactobacillus satsumensis]MCP9356711.1 transcriptional regulator [Liquorilactobacillus satsumensis]MCP9370651.1 transcriptional regulator [Liquorilactobacillus satsumensis]